MLRTLLQAEKSKAGLAIRKRQRYKTPAVILDRQSNVFGTVTYADSYLRSCCMFEDICHRFPTDLQKAETYPWLYLTLLLSETQLQFDRRGVKKLLG